MLAMRANRIRAGVLSLVVMASAGRAFALPENTTADGVLGQLNFTSNQMNEGGNASAASLNGNRGLAVDRSSGRLWVCDTSNNRVLSWPSAASFKNHESADIVLGQADFTSNNDNRGNANPAANTLSGPRGVAIDSAGRVYVADSGNKRILRFDPPITNGKAAIQVFGQNNNFNTANQAAANAATADNLGNPDGVAVDSAGNVYVADLFLHRVLRYNTPAASDTTADIVIGQVNFTTADRDQNGNAAANTLDNPEGVAVDGSDNLYVVDQGNNRVLRYVAPITTNMAATRVFGQPDFSTETAGTTATKMSVPVAAALDPISGSLYVADSINHRVLEFTDPANDSTADRVFGQPNLTSGASNPGGVSANTLFDVGGVALDAEGNLHAGDRLNNRLLRYDAAPDADADGVPDSTDNCPSASNANQANADGDSAGDACDGCPNDATKTSAGACGCGVADTDGDGDGVADCVDNCPSAANADQADADTDGTGDACESTGGGGTPGAPCGVCGVCGAGAAPLLPIMFLLMSRRWNRRRSRRQ